MKTNDAGEQNTLTPEMVLTQEAQHYLHGAGKWASFLGIIGFIGSAFTLVAAVFVGNIAEIIAKFKPTSPTYPNAMGGVVGLIYVVIAIFYFFLSLSLFRFGNNIKTGLLFADAVSVSKAFRKLRSFFKLWGIASIIIIILFIIILIAAVLIGIGWQS
jgi:hypothetical protein